MTLQLVRVAASLGTASSSPHRVLTPWPQIGFSTWMSTSLIHYYCIPPSSASPGCIPVCFQSHPTTDVNGRGRTDSTGGLILLSRVAMTDMLTPLSPTALTSQLKNLKTSPRHTRADGILDAEVVTKETCLPSGLLCHQLVAAPGHGPEEIAMVR